MIFFFLKQKLWVFAEERDDLTRENSDKFSAIIGEVERLHELGIQIMKSLIFLLTNVFGC